jgi:hypothetical protein
MEPLETGPRPYAPGRQFVRKCLREAKPGGQTRDRGAPASTRTGDGTSSVRFVEAGLRYGVEAQIAPWFSQESGSPGMSGSGQSGWSSLDTPEDAA